MSNQKSKVCLASGRPALTIAVVAVVVMALFSSAPTTPVQAAEKYPSRPIEGILPVGVGGGPDRLSVLSSRAWKNCLGWACRSRIIRALAATRVWPS